MASLDKKRLNIPANPATTVKSDAMWIPLEYPATIVVWMHAHVL